MFRLKYFCASVCLVCATASSAAAYLYFLPDFCFVGPNGEIICDSSPHHFPDRPNSCPQLGYPFTSCPSGYSLYDPCPVSSKYYKECKKDPNCEDLGYVSSCPEGQIPDLSDVCPEDGNWYKCICDPCEGYEYTYEQATAEGYIVNGAGCQSCDVMKYKRKPAPCVGYNYDNMNCNVTSCGNLEGGSCRSGNVTKYEKCTPCPVTCPSGQENMDTYWCSSAWRCLMPTS